MNTNVLRAVFKRNFVGYFANPTGYVFICVFVSAASFAAFWPYAFFNSNLANLAQLNHFFPLIMLFFVPAITMSVWAEERREGTDELLLTIPAGDIDIVAGKYLAAVAIYSVSLLFSLICNFTMLWWLAKGNLDIGLFLGTYFGYWLVGLGMLSVGLVASFLTSNLTVAFVLGVLFNLPLVAASLAEAVFSTGLGRAVGQWSIGEQFASFGRGVIGLSGIAYFTTILAVMLYLSMVLIGRRHWARGRDSQVMGLHYLVRTVALVFIAGAVVVFCGYLEVAVPLLRADATKENINSLSPKTRDLLANLDIKRPVQIEAFISPEVPEMYIQTRENLLNMLYELRATGGSKVTVRIHSTEPHTDEATRAEERYGIAPRPVQSLDRGRFSQEDIFMGVAFTSGLEKVTLPFINRGIPVEYELVRSICTVTQQKRKRIGILQTDAQLYGQFNMQRMSAGRNWPIIDELEKMYDVIRVDASSPITEKYDVLVAVQPSSLGPDQMPNFVKAVQAGQPTAIFEDPFPYFAGSVPGTSDPRRPPGGMNPMMMQQQPPPKGNIDELWDLLDVRFTPSSVVWQDYNPFPKIEQFSRTKEFVFVDTANSGNYGQKTPFNLEDPATKRLQMMLLLYTGSLSARNAAERTFEPLVRSSLNGGTVPITELRQMSMFGMGRLNERPRRGVIDNLSHILAARIGGEVTQELPTPDPAEGEDSEKPEEVSKPTTANLNVVLVADIDMLSPAFFQLREEGNNPEAGVDLNFDNVAFILNIIDDLAGDDRQFSEIRSRRPEHRTLTRIDEVVEKASADTAKQREARQQEFDQTRDDEQKKLDEGMEKLRTQMQENQLDEQEILRRFAMEMQTRQARMNQRIEQLQRKQERQIAKIEREQESEIRQTQNTYKTLAVLLPPIPPLLIGIAVFFTRRSREREGVARSRLRG